MASELTFDRFRGLNLAADPVEVGGDTAIELSNVEFDNRGRVRQRRGSAIFNNTAGAKYTQLIPTPSVLLALSYSAPTTTFAYLDSVGFRTVLGTKASWVFSSYTAIGTPTSSYTFLAASIGILRRFDNNALTIVDSVGSPKFVATWQNRLVQASFGSAASSPTGADGSTDTVFFSDVAAPETYSADNFERLSPGDGEAIIGMVAWHDQLYVFKDTSMFVFYDIGLDADNLPVFNWRRVDLGIHAGSVVAGREGVYISAREGIYLTTGDEPVELTQAIAPLFKKHETTYTIHFADNRLYIMQVPNVEGTAGYPWLVLDTTNGEWTIWKLVDSPDVASYPTAWAGTGRVQTYYVADSRDSVMALDIDLSDDDGTPITWYWRSGWYDMGRAQALKTTRWTRLWGGGTPTVSIYTDFSTSDANAAAVTLATAPDPADFYVTAAYGEGYHKVAYSGILFSHKLSGSGRVLIDRLVHDIAGVRP